MNKTLLVIEDDVLIMETIKDLLTLSGYTVLSAYNGEVGFQRLEENIPDLIVCDVMMPVMDGIKFLKRLKLSKEYQGIPFLYLSAKSREQDVAEGLSLGANGYIFKPFSNRDFLDKINKTLGTTQAL